MEEWSWAVSFVKGICCFLHLYYGYPVACKYRAWSMVKLLQAVGCDMVMLLCLIQFLFVYIYIYMYIIHTCCTSVFCLFYVLVLFFLYGVFCLQVK